MLGRELKSTERTEILPKRTFTAVGGGRCMCVWRYSKKWQNAIWPASSVYTKTTSKVILSQITIKIQVRRKLIIDILDPFGVSIFSVILSPPAGLSTAGWFASRS